MPLTTTDYLFASKRADLYAAGKTCKGNSIEIVLVDSSTIGPRIVYILKVKKVSRHTRVWGWFFHMKLRKPPIEPQPTN